jgi:hypothetical protein
MFWEHLRKIGLRVLSILILVLTLGAYSIPGVEAREKEAQQKKESCKITSLPDPSDRDLQNNLKDKVRADYRDSIGDNRGLRHTG